MAQYKGLCPLYFLPRDYSFAKRKIFEGENFCFVKLIFYS